MATMIYDMMVLGAGGAGLICAAEAGQRGAKVLLVDHNKQPGKKILISGGGRCNFTNLDVRPDRYLSQNPHFAKSALARYTQWDFIDLVNAHKIAWHEKTLGQLFCDGSAKQIVAMLLAEGAKGQVTHRFGEQIKFVHHNDAGFEVGLDSGTYRARTLVIATGGPSIPKLGATGFAYELAKQFGLKIIPPRPALVPLTLGGDDVLFRDISGVAAPVVASCDGTAFQEAALFTHKGLSGPAILQISSYWTKGKPVSIDFLPEQPDHIVRDLKTEHPNQFLHNVLPQCGLPARLAQVLTDRLGPAERLGHMKDAALQQHESQLRNWQFQPNGTEGYAKAEVTAGGIDTAALSSKTMEATGIKGLYIIGEAVDVTGWLGGYNFQWAWSSGVAAGQAIATTLD